MYHLYLYLIWRLQLTPLLHNGVKMTLKRSLILLVFFAFTTLSIFIFQLQDNKAQL